MVGMPVGDDQMIDCLEPRLGSGHLVDALGVAGTGEAVVNEDAFALRRYDQRGGPALRVDKVDVQAAWLLGLNGEREEEETQGEHLAQLHGRDLRGNGGNTSRGP